MNTAAATMAYDVVRADLPPGLLLDAAHGRMFRVTELSADEKREVFRATPSLDDRDAVADGLVGSAARLCCTGLRCEYDAAAEGVGRVLDGKARRYAVRPASVESLIRALDAEADLA